MHENNALITAEGIDAGYDKKQVLRDVTIRIGSGEAVALLGHNGAGKTTLVNVIFGLLPIWKGKLSFSSQRLSARHSAKNAVNLGMAMIPAERFVFPDLTVLENLRLSARTLNPTDRAAAFDSTYESFPILKEREIQLAGSMSGGQQRIVSLAMALMCKPRLLLLDEPSLGLSPVFVEQMMTKVRELVGQGMSVLLVEQNVRTALSIASRVYVLRAGQIILEESAQSLDARGPDNWWSLF